MTRIAIHRSLLAACAALLLIAAPAGAAITPGWAPAADLRLPRAGHAAVLLDNGKILVAGGDSTTKTTVELFDPATNTWSTAAPMHSPRSFFPMLKLPGGKVLVAGGSALYKTELYDPATDTWTKLPDTAQPHDRGSLVLLDTGKVMLIGGNNWETSLGEVF